MRLRLLLLTCDRIVVRRRNGRRTKDGATPRASASAEVGIRGMFSGGLRPLWERRAHHLHYLIVIVSSHAAARIIGCRRIATTI